MPVKSMRQAALGAALAGVASAAVMDLPITVQNGYRMVDVTAGTPAKPYRLIFDTGSATSWIVDSECSETCPNVSGYERNGYDIEESFTGEYTGQDASIDYLGGVVVGQTVQDVMSFDGTQSKQEFLAVNETTWATHPADGFMGLAFGSIADGGAAPIFEVLMSEDLVDEPRFGLYYEQSTEDTPEGQTGPGVLTLGGSREEEYVDGDMTEVSIFRPGGGYDVWRSLLFSLRGTKTKCAGGEVSKDIYMGFTDIVFDTGGSAFSVPPDHIEEIYASIGMNWTAILNGDHLPLCSEFTDKWSITLSVGADYRTPQNLTLTGDMFALPGFAGRDDACWPPLESSDATGFSLMGARLLKRFYTVWDYGANPKDDPYYEPTLSFGNLRK